MSKPIDPQGALEQLWKLAPQYAQAKANRVYLEEFRKTLKAQLMKACGESSIGAQEREAYADETYANHLKGLSVAVEQEEVLRWRLIASQAAIEVWRSQEASNRAMDRATA
jgi:hypothetical protein